MTTPNQPMVLVADASAITALFHGNTMMMGVYQMAEREKCALVLPILPIAVASAAVSATEDSWEAILLPPGVYQTNLPVEGAVGLAGDLIASHPDASVNDAQTWQTAWEARQLGAGARIITAEPEQYKFLKPPGVIVIN